MEIQDHAQARHPVPPAGPAINRRFAREPVHARVLRVMALGCGLRFRLAVLAVGEEYSGSSEARRDLAARAFQFLKSEGSESLKAGAFL